MSVCVCVHMCVCTRVCMFVNMRVHVCAYVCAHTCVCSSCHAPPHPAAGSIDQLVGPHLGGVPCRPPSWQHFTHPGTRHPRPCAPTCPPLPSPLSGQGRSPGLVPRRGTGEDGEGGLSLLALQQAEGLGEGRESRGSGHRPPSPSPTEGRWKGNRGCAALRGARLRGSAEGRGGAGRGRAVPGLGGEQPTPPSFPAPRPGSQSLGTSRREPGRGCGRRRAALPGAAAEGPGSAPGGAPPQPPFSVLQPTRIWPLPWELIFFFFCSFFF